MTRQIMVGPVPVGGGAPVTIQSMTNTPTADVDATLRQIRALAAAGCEIVRVAVPDLEAARSWQPGPLAAYLDQEVTGTPGESMAAYWERTRGVGAEKNAL